MVLCFSTGDEMKPTTQSASHGTISASQIPKLSVAFRRMGSGGICDRSSCGYVVSPIGLTCGENFN